MRLFKKATKEEKIKRRVDNTFSELNSDIEFQFSDLETVQILNEIRIKLVKKLENKKQECLNTITIQNGILKEIDIAMSFLK